MDPLWERGCYLLRPADVEVSTMLQELCAAMGGTRELAAACGIPRLTLDKWLDGTRSPTGAARKAIWLLWALLLHPERCTSLFDVWTWGRCRTIKPSVQTYPPNGSPPAALNDSDTQAAKWFYEI